jgi:hypothetical protein
VNEALKAGQDASLVSGILAKKRVVTLEKLAENQR